MVAGLCKSDPARVHYERHRPENTALYRLVQDQAETFFAQVEAETAHGLPDYIKTEFNAFLDCGILANGFLRLKCGDCHHEKIVAFSWPLLRIHAPAALVNPFTSSKRGFCPSCGARRMADDCMDAGGRTMQEQLSSPPRTWWITSFRVKRFGTRAMDGVYKSRMQEVE